MNHPWLIVLGVFCGYWLALAAIAYIPPRRNEKRRP